MPHVAASSLARSLPLTHSLTHRGVVPTTAVIRIRCSSQVQPLSEARSQLTDEPHDSDLSSAAAAQSPGSLLAPPSSRAPHLRPSLPPSFPSPASHPRALRHLPAALGGPASAQLSCEKPRGLLGDVVRDNALDEMALGGRGFSAEAWPKAHTRRRDAPRWIRATVRQPPPLPVKSTPKS